MALAHPSDHQGPLGVDFVANMMLHRLLLALIPLALSQSIAAQPLHLPASNSPVGPPRIVIDERAQLFSVSWEGVPDLATWQLDGIEDIQSADGDRVVDIAELESLSPAVYFDTERPWRTLRLQAFSDGPSPSVLGSWMLFPDGTIFEVCLRCLQRMQTPR